MNGLHPGVISYKKMEYDRPGVYSRIGLLLTVTGVSTTCVTVVVIFRSKNTYKVPLISFVLDVPSQDKLKPFENQLKHHIVFKHLYLGTP